VLVRDDLTVTSFVPAGSTPAATAPRPISSVAVGSVVADRYEILKLLGEGGMGAVYKATDLELNRTVALKIIRPELASRPEVLQRFKQELILARKITHRNVIRIFDLGVTDQMKFITMEYVEGRDLESYLRESRPSPREAVNILRQVCEALEAAHSEQVVHRDLKPQNIMMDETGRVHVMDFGLARSVEGDALTRTGAFMGTPAYMSPEQAKGIPVDARSDIFALGIIFYELLTGEVPFRADTVLGSLLMRTQGPPPPPLKLNAAIPRPLNDITLKCLAVDREKRYQSVRDIITDLDSYQTVPGSGGSILSRTIVGRTILGGRGIVTPRFTTMSESTAWKWIGGSIAVVLMVLGGVYAVARIQGWLGKPQAPPPPMSVLIADFNNHTGDPVFNGTLESTLKLSLEGASFISAYDRTRMRDLGLRALTGPLDGAKAQEVAANQGVNIVVSGSVDRKGSEYQLSARAVQTVTGKIVATADERAPNKDQVLFAVGKMGIAVRKALGDSTSESAQRLSMETLTAESLDAVHEYAAALDALSGGKFDDAQQRLSRAVELDPNFGMAYTVMASAARNLGRHQDAEKYIREALKHSAGMTERERYRTRGLLYMETGAYQKCVEEYGALLDRYPADTGAYTNMTICQLHLHNVPKALDAARKAVAILPKRAIYHGNLAMNLAFGGDGKGAAKEAAETLKLGFPTGHLYEAQAALLQEQPAEAAEAYHKFEKSNPSDAAAGLADLAVFEGRYSEAVKILEKGIADDMAERKPDPDSAATKLWTLANVQLLRHQKAPALAAARRALELSKAFQTRFAAAQVFAALGEADKAREIADGLAAELPIEPQAYAKLIQGEAALQAGDGRGAIKLFQDGNALIDTWTGRFDLGRAYLAIGAFPEADSEFDRCIARRGEALALFLDLPTYGYFPPVYYYQGRAREGLKSAGFTESYRKYVAIRGKAGEDPLLPEIKHRIGQ
jgi:tetratricopeptide (TPR) repeat protein